MTTLAETVTIDRRFARSARIDRDLGGTPPLVGYVMQASVAKALSTLACSQVESSQGAFTWTGPYGGGKSCAALLLANLVGGRGENRRVAREIAGDELVALYEEAFPPVRRAGWSVIPVTGSRGGLREAIAAAAQASLGWTDTEAEAAATGDEALIDALEAHAARSPTLVILDELGKLLEFAALHDGDVHLLQDLAERASRSDGRLVVLGILHQAFDQYAARAARDARREWAKVQGRFQDIPFLAGPDETVALLGRAIGCARRPRAATAAAAATAAQVARQRPTDERSLAAALALTWPLNPVTSLLLGPVSRQRFAQNERSVFGFLGSSEPAGFQEHLATTAAKDARTYGPDRLWDYLATNFGMALAGGPNGAKFSLAFEAIERAGAKGGPLHVALTKSAAMIEFFRNGSGLAVSDPVLGLCAPRAAPDEVASAIADLLEWAILMPQPRLGGYALFAGSDFDLDEAVARAAAPAAPGDLAPMPQRVGLGSVAAKRHYFRTGTLRTFEVVMDAPSAGEKAADIAARLSSRDRRGSGLVALITGDGALSRTEVEVRCRLVAKALGEAGVIAAVGAAPDGSEVAATAAELLAVERVMRDNPRLEGDRIARREIAARHSACVDRLQRGIDAALNDAKWWLTTASATRPVQRPLPALASDLADTAFDATPTLHSELLQRERPSSSAAAAVRNLCHAMVGRHGERDLGFSGFPAEMGLYMTVLAPFGLHRDDGGGHDFHPPLDEGPGATLQAAWSVLEDAPDTRLDEVYATWAEAPFGIKAGVMPILALASLMARRDRVAVYIDDVFQTSFDDVMADKLLQRPQDVRVRRIDRSLQEAAYLSGLAQLLDLPVSTAALPVAQALFRRFEDLPPYSRRTARIDPEARAVRDAVLRSDDPETLLFERLPEALGGRLSAEAVHGGLVASEGAYGDLLAGLSRSLARGLGVDATTFEGLAARAASVRDLTNDYAFEAYAMRAAAFDGGEADIEGLASLLLHRPPRNWSDRDADQALLQLAALARRFRETEALAIVRDRSSSAEALALLVGLDPTVPPVLRSFTLAKGERKAADALAARLVATLGDVDVAPNVRLAAIARAIADVSLDGDANGATTARAA